MEKDIYYYKKTIKRYEKKYNLYCTLYSCIKLKVFKNKMNYYNYLINNYYKYLLDNEDILIIIKNLF